MLYVRARVNVRARASPALEFFFFLIFFFNSSKKIGYQKFVFLISNACMWHSCMCVLARVCVRALVCVAHVCAPTNQLKKKLKSKSFSRLSWDIKPMSIFEYVRT